MVGVLVKARELRLGDAVQFRNDRGEPGEGNWIVHGLEVDEQDDVLGIWTHLGWGGSDGMMFYELDHELVLCGRGCDLGPVRSVSEKAG